MASAPLSFRRWDTPPGLAPSLIFGERTGSGIYVLEFADGDEYVGQSIHPASRFASHRRRWDDIVAVRFAEVPPPHDLNRAEQDQVTDRRRAGVPLRNKTLLAQPFGESALDAIVDQEEQAAWIDADPNRAEIVIAPERIRQARARITVDPDRLPAALRQHPHASDAIESIASFICDVVPLPAETEGRGWVLSAWPSTNRTSTHRRFSTLSIQNVELLFLFEDRLPSGKWVQTTVMNVAPTLKVPAGLGDLVQESSYRTTGPVRSFVIDDWNQVGALLSEPAALLAARELALGQLRKGRAMFSRFHSQALADEAFMMIGDALDWQGGDTLPL